MANVIFDVRDLSVDPEGTGTPLQVVVTGGPGPAGPAGEPGAPGQSAYEIAVDNGFAGTELEWLDSLQGVDGDDGESAYDIAVANGFVGTEADWLASLVGTAGQDGADGTNGRSPEFQKSATHIQWRLVGDTTWLNLVALADLKGDKGDPGLPGADGVGPFVVATVLTGAGIASAAAEAGIGGRVYLLPGETYELTAPLTLDRVGLIGDGSPTINVATDLGAGTSAITITSTVDSSTTPEGSANSVLVQGFRLSGPGARTLGVKTSACDGIAIAGKAKPILRDVRVGQFGSGIVWNNDVGHIYHDHVEVTDCYYGIFCKKNTYDYFVTDSRIDGNTFANFATPADQGFAAMVLTNVHMGFAPYAIYQESTPAAQGSNKVFLQEVVLRHARMESIGNAAIYSEATEDGTNHSVTADLLIEHPGFSWNATYKIAARDKNYAVVLPFTQRNIRILLGSNPFTAGDANVYRVKLANHSAFEVVGSTAAATQVAVDSGTANVFAYARPLTGGGLSVGGDAVNSTATLGSTSGYVMPGGSSSRRFGGDASYLYADVSSDFRWRNSSSGYALIGRVNSSGIAMPTYYLGSAGSQTGPRWTSGSGSPEGVTTAPVGSVYSRTDGGTSTSLYVKESGTGNTGWVAYGPASAGGTSSAPRVATRTTGSFSLATATNYADVTTEMDLVVPAVAGDWIEVALASGLNPSGTQTVGLDFATIVSGAAVNYVSGAGSSGLGVQAWGSAGSGIKPIGGSVMYQVQAGDLSGGNVTFRLRYKVNATGVTLFAQSDRPMQLWAQNRSR